ncbi:hypothetical protein E1B28_000510 [Marasmius oreades]|uniref:DASH complex subunit DUO1 n=1 Tax=Marasmius oreades TaxID=181124 RepID=A0A9P8AEF8_9AGAR|nr:uncharacterized protein E1B28_000510 [Marasmius oreades]KAG7098579.1 hypothetical protein E1B28_000510 [Marasmius oreades]
MSESPIPPSTSTTFTVTSDGDPSVSELSLSDRTTIQSKPFSLLAQPFAEARDLPESRENSEEEVLTQNDELDEEEKRTNAQTAVRQREEKLQRDIVVLKKLNSAFTAFNDALDGVGSANTRISEQLNITEMLLNKYMKVLARSEEFARLIFDEEFEGAEADEELIERERADVAERERKEAEKRALEAERERERKAREAQELLEKELRERAERERAAASSGVIRGVRGTRASMRGARGASAISRGVTSNTRGGTPPNIQPASGSRSSSVAGRASGIITRGTTGRRT